MTLTHFGKLMPVTRERMRRVAVTCALLFLPSCIDHVEEGDSSIRGTYTLRSVNGAAPPFTKSVVGTTKVELLEDNITLFLGNTMSEDVVQRTTTNGVATTQTTTLTGTYFPAMGNSVVLAHNGGASRIVVITNGNTMTFSEAGASYVWKK